MGQTTKIEWCDSTVNPVMGCDGCELWSSDNKTCYAGRLHQVYGNNKGYASEFTSPEMFAGRMAEAARWKPLQLKIRKGKPWLDKLPRHIFVSDMGDALSWSIPFEFLRAEIIDVVRTEPGRFHRWLWLTKRPSRMVKFSRYLEDLGVQWPRQLWAMTSITGRASQGRAAQLLRVGPPDVVRGISFEPLWDRPDWAQCLDPVMDRKIGWAIFGFESGPGARAGHMAVLLEGIAECRRRGIPVFVKQLGSTQPIGLSMERYKITARAGERMEEWPEETRLREMPRVAA